VSGMRFDELVAVRVAAAGEPERATTLAAFFRDNPGVAPDDRRDIRGAVAARITWCVGDPARPAWTIRADTTAASQSAA